ncbi:hypothetical protein GJ699_03455 [Duganella sp. FT80W]|uniref:Uncharacterized protein n=1 Tax=Duganella guangzhouensis TaxID=2666084 RepID=A0A6I2KTD9_9BURK|nr:hypothetical protein [Duganella guangzhouensis]MRW89033.1 hypothetical protein [Duganella guangzhouensis]
MASSFCARDCRRSFDIIGSSNRKYKELRGLNQKRMNTIFPNTAVNWTNTILVAKVHWYGDESAEVTLRSSLGEIIVFGHMFNAKEGDRISNRLSILNGNVRAAFLSDWPEELKEELSVESIERTGPYAYRGRGRVIDSEEGLVQACGFIINFNDMLYCEVVDFEIERLDVHTD